MILKEMIMIVVNFEVLFMFQRLFKVFFFINLFYRDIFVRQGLFYDCFFVDGGLRYGEVE